ncbi:unnamed protein product [Allacma fusca]|uniref:Uncharacterized protein n=1 Tax=Allacma fusca TaxID=39272 RepID=A0A8J2PNP4_9HEXA|nr:unnamed protein product [Allacma fusca]
MDVPTKVELKFTYLMLVQRPSIITLGNYVKVNKKMLLRVLFQVLTFTIAMMQFNNSLRHEATYPNKILQ